MLNHNVHAQQKRKIIKRLRKLRIYSNVVQSDLIRLSLNLVLTSAGLVKPRSRGYLHALPPDGMSLNRFLRNLPCRTH